MYYQCPECDKEGKTPEDVQNAGCNCKIEPWSMTDPEDHDETKQKKSDKTNPKDERTSSKILFDFVKSKIIKTVISENNSDEVYAVVLINNHHEILNLASTRARHWLRYEYSRNIDENEIHSDDFFKNVLNSIISQAQMNGTVKEKIHNRIAQLDEEIWYDLGTPDWKAIKITKENITTVNIDQHSPLFRRSQSMQQQVIPKKGVENALNKLVDWFHILPQDKIIFKSHLISLFLEAFPMPMMVLDGSAGSLKTTITASIKQIVDPSGKAKEDNVATMSEKIDDLIIQLYNRYLSGFDNVSRVNDKVSDILCRAITGGSNPKRKLYSDDDEVIHTFKRKIILNGIIPTLEYPDLQTRIISYARTELTDDEKITEKSFSKKFNELLSYLLGEIFITLSRALKLYPVVEKDIQPKTRMSDFEIWGEAISRALGNAHNDFLNRYHEKLDEDTIESQESYPAIFAILELMEHRNEYEDSMSNFYGEISHRLESSGIDLKERYLRFPKSSNKLRKHLIVLEPILKTNDIKIVFYSNTKNDDKYTKNATIVKITKRTRQKTIDNSFENLSSPPSLSSPDKNHVQITGKIGEGNREDKLFTQESFLLQKSDSRHENNDGDHGEDGEDTLGKDSTMNSKK